MNSFGIFDGQWIDVFRAGDYGDKGSYTPEDLDRMVQGFQSTHPEVPAVVGHPETDSPAYGWVDKVRRVGDVLQIQLKDVYPDFEDAVRKGLYRTRSVAIGADKLLRHIGFLGGATPHVKGLKPVQFHGGEFRTFDYKESDMDVVQEVKGALKEFGEKLDKLFAGSSGDRKFSETEARQFAAEKLGQVQAEFSALQKKFDTASAEFAAAQDAAKTKCPKCGAVFAEKEREAVAAASDFINKLKQDGKWLPAFSAMGAEAIIIALAKDGGKATFGEGDKKTEKPLHQAFTDFITGLEKIKPVPTGKVHTGTPGKTGGSARFADNPNVDQESVELNERAEALAAEKNIPFADALRQVYRETQSSGSASAAAV